MRQSTEIGRVGLATAACAVLALMLTGCSLEAGDFSALGMGSTAAVREVPSTTEPARPSVPRADMPDVKIAASTPAEATPKRSIAPPAPAAVPPPMVRNQPAPVRQVAQATTSDMRAGDEAEMLARARAEAAAEREQAEERRAEEIRQQARAKMEQDREAELRDISERLRRQQESRVATPPPPPARPEPPQQAPTPAKDRDQADAARPTTQPAEAAETPKGGRVAVLLVMQAGNRGIRRFEKTGDPLLCTAAGCYVSAGTSAPATFLPGRKAFGFTNTMGPRAGACSNSLVCVYRGVQLGSAGDFLQPVDMRLIRHDRRESKPASEDSRCRISSGGIDCRRPLVGADFRIWIVPEALAEQAGARALEQAVQEGLPDQRQAALTR